MSNGKNVSWVTVIYLILSMVVLGAVWLIRNVLKLALIPIVKAYRVIAVRAEDAKVSEALAAALVRGAPASVPAMDKASEPISNEAVTVAPAAVRLKQHEEFVAADRIVTIRLDPPVAVLHLRVYKSLGLVKREMIVNEPRLRALLEGRRHTLPDAKYDSEVGMDGIKNDTVLIVQELINLKGNAKVKPVKADKPVKQAVVQEIVPKVAPPTKKVQPPVNPIPPAEPAKAFVPKMQLGVAFHGILVAAGVQTVKPRDRAPYDTFEAKIRLDTGMDVPLRGVELDRKSVV